jgi:hypothetical protein
MLYFFECYLKHTALNVGQLTRDIRFFYYHPKAENKFAPSIRRLTCAVTLRIESFFINLYYSLLPPHFHHTNEELTELKKSTLIHWFLFGYAPWNYDKN